MLAGTLSLNIPGVKSALDKLDAQKAKFLSVPANVRAALDRLGRIRVIVPKNGPVTVEFQEASQIVEQNLKQTQIQWETAAERFSMLDTMRRTGSGSVSADTILLASQLLTSVGYVIKNADSNIAAVERLADKYLTAEQRNQLSIQTTGVKRGVSMPLVLGIVAAAYFLRRR